MKIRQIMGIPIRSIGVICFLIYEIIAGDKTTFRAQEVIDLFKEHTTATCSKCGHQGYINKVIHKAIDKE